MTPLHISTQGTVEHVRQTKFFRIIDTSHCGGCRLERHGHALPGITLITGGEYLEIIDRGEIECDSGTVVFKPAGAYHSNRYGLNGARALHIEIVDELFFGERLEFPNRIVTVQKPKMQSILKAMPAAFASQDDTSVLMLDSLGMEIVSLVIRSTNSRFRIGRTPHWLFEVVEILESNEYQMHSLSALSMATGIPPRTIARQFRRWMGISVGDYVRNTRLKKAKEKLQSIRDSIAQISFDLGFFDQSHFSRFFKNETGFSPAYFRKKCASES